jgi:hypothetical protein
LIYFHFEPLGFTSFIVAINFSKFFTNFSFPKDNFPKIEWTFHCLSVLNSNFQAAISFTIAIRSSQTVPVFGFGISPFGHSTLAIFHICLIIVGVATQTSKSKAISHLAIHSIKSSHPAITAQADFRSALEIVSEKAQTFTVFPVP